ncbi:MAG: NUDIX-like domain-containing protein, partial [Rubrobacteraceae bacterium]
MLFFAFRGDELLLREDDEAHVQMAASLEDIGLTSLFQHEIGTLGDRRCVAVEVAPEVDAPEGMRFADLRGIFAIIGEDVF